ncbi:class I SAM-dependent methyltransferase [Methanosarcina sp. T3]|uniref:class I SAM-dependent methyltransferase n=1 Tax=Methanosarcina sp. T3 TaxID=3439062 RepID=UPI003F867AA3
MDSDVIDWNEVWKETLEKQLKSNRNVDCATIWYSKENAMRFWRMFQGERSREITAKRIEGMKLSPDSRVLDIGAGPGTLAIPISQRVAHVTAVEPSEGMMNVMRDNIKEYGIENIDPVHKDWEAVDVESDLSAPYDVVFASYSLGMKDIRTSVQKMVDASSKYVYLYWFAGETSWDMHSRKLWPLLHGSEYQPAPKCDVLYNVLYDMGIYPNVSVFPFEHVHRFATLDEAVEDFMSYYNASSDTQKAILRDYFEGVLETDNGALIQRGWSTRVKMWWEKTN